MVAIDYSRLRVLIVEDEPYTRQLVRQLLHQLGVRSIIEAAGLNEHETWQLLRGNAIECFGLERIGITV